ncbi:MAG: Unknown protein [uncultured Sulfurovum sp.]|uniref:Uncharacterized protein n=1 Tax=uncultured Sulfurovum sp. TaxID=269237 RepID=A0A6S6SL87_9BACT|nr:MAG: Unknown protein [uncultured Sulfurovum sp.]
MKRINFVSFLNQNKSVPLNKYIQDIAKENNISESSILSIVPEDDLIKAFLGTQEGFSDTLKYFLNTKEDISFDFQGIAVEITHNVNDCKYEVSYQGNHYTQNFKDTDSLTQALSQELLNMTEPYVQNKDLQKVMMKIIDKEAENIEKLIGPVTSSDDYTHKLRRILNSDVMGGTNTIQSKLLEIAHTMQHRMLQGEEISDALEQCKSEIKNNTIHTLKNTIYISSKLNPHQEVYNGEKKDFSKYDYTLEQSYTDNLSKHHKYIFSINEDGSLSPATEIDNTLKVAIPPQTPIVETKNLQTYIEDKDDATPKELYEQLEEVELKINSEFLLVRQRDKQAALDKGAIYDKDSNLFYITKDQKRNDFIPYLKENNPNPANQGIGENITNDDFRQAVESFLSQRGFHIRDNQPYEEESSRWIKVYKDGQKVSKGGIKIKQNICDKSGETEPYKNVLLFQDWTNNGKTPESYSANDLFNDSKFITNQIRIRLSENQVSYNSLSKKDKEMSSLWTRTRNQTSNLYMDKKDILSNIEKLLYQKGEDEVVRRFKNANNDMKKILAHPYIKKKSLPQEYLSNFRISGNTLLIPLIKNGIKAGAEKAKLINLQRIYQVDNKDEKQSKNIIKQYGINVSKEDKEVGITRYNTSSKGVYFIASESQNARTIKDLNKKQPIILVEGVGTGIFLAKALKDKGIDTEVVCGMSIGGIKAVLEDIKRDNPKLLANVVISADNDVHKTYIEDQVIEEKNVGKMNSIQYCEEFGVSMALPDFSFMSKEELLEQQPSDWEDLYKLKGADSVVTQLNNRLREIYSTQTTQNQSSPSKTVSVESSQDANIQPIQP